MTTSPPAPFIILSQDATHVLRLVQQSYATTLQDFTDRGCEQVSLDEDELRAFLLALPPSMLLDVVMAQAEAEHAAQDAPHDDCLTCGVCLACGPCTCAADIKPAVTQQDVPIPDESTKTPAAVSAFASLQLARLVLLPCRVDAMTPREYAIYEALTPAVAALQFIADAAGIQAVMQECVTISGKPRNPQRWLLCVCDVHPGVHIADAACVMAIQQEEG